MGILRCEAAAQATGLGAVGLDRDCTMPDFPHNIWAPWRMEYIHALAGEAGGCFLCDYAAHPEKDAASLVLWRTADVIVLLNRFPYTNGHLLIAPLAHRGDLCDFSAEQLAELMRHTTDAKRLLAEAVGAQGFNIGINFGRCAGAGLPDHLHVHVVPRWNGDTNFMAVLGSVRVIPDGLEQCYARLRAAAEKLGLAGG